jgi:hypothetical protein
MKASEAADLTHKCSLNLEELNSVFSAIRGAAEQGRSIVYFKSLSNSVMKELTNLDYVVNTIFDKNEHQYSVAWAWSARNNENN